MDREGKENKICIICEKEKQEGYFLLHSFICSHCEQQIVQTEPDDPLYLFYVRQLRKVEQHLLQKSKVLKNPE